MKRNAVFLFIVGLLCFALVGECVTSLMPFLEAYQAATTAYGRAAFVVPTGLLVVGATIGTILGSVFCVAGLGILWKK